MSMETSLAALMPTPFTPPPANTGERSMTEAEFSRFAAAQVVFQDITRTFDITFVPDLFESMRDRPAYLEAAWELFKEDVNLDRLDRRTKLTIALALTTNEAGVYFIAALPHAFKLDALDRSTYDKVRSAIRFFDAFDRYLSGVMPRNRQEATSCLTACLRDEYRSYEAPSDSPRAPMRKERETPAHGTLPLILVFGFILPIAMALYLLFG